MYMVVFVARLVGSAAVIGVQLFVLFEYGVLDGFFYAGLWQLLLQFGAMLVAPPGVKMWVARAAGFCAIIVGLACIVSVVMVVVPLAGIIATMEGDFTFIYYGSATLAFLALSFGVTYLGFLLDD